MKRHQLAFILLALLALPSCKVQNQWSFPVSRSAYGSAESGSGSGFGSCNGSEAEAIFVLAIILLPIAIDLVILPVTLLHDLTES
ncbi:MAG: hypothetical protein ACI8X5_000538 [Planctomycetota bacterium]